MAGLLTYSQLGAFPSLHDPETVARVPKKVGAYSSGNCPGFTPGSLFSFFRVKKLSTIQCTSINQKIGLAKLFVFRVL
jgi:hypothetical protein